MTQQTEPRSSIARRRRRILAAAVGATLLLTACAGSDAGVADQISDEISDTEVSGTESVDTAPEFLDPSDPDIARAIVLADQLVGELGDDDTAADALLTAFAAGYSSRQVLAAVEADELLADGTVSGVEPDGSALDLSEVEPKRRRLRAESTADEPLPIERLRDAANQLGGDNDNNVGNLATTVIIALANIGLTPEEIVEVLVLGEVEYERNGVCVRKVIDKFPERCDARSDDDPEPEATIAVDPTTPSDSEAPESGEAALIDGTYTGAFDFESRRGSEAIENTVTVVVDGGIVSSFDGTFHVSFPYYEDEDGSVCPDELVQTVVVVPGSISATTFDIELTDVQTFPAFADCPGSEPITQTFVATLTMATTDEGATVSGVDTDFMLELTRS